MDGANDYAFWYEPVYEVTRGEIVESVHFGALAVVDADGRLIASRGSAEAFAYLRSTAKPFQALPLIEAGGVERFGFTQAEIALMCASHSGTDEHADVAASIQSKVDVGELDLMCGVHPPMHEPTAAKLRDAGQQPTPNRHNCSGKHSGMLALAQLNGWPVQHYIDPIHPVQQQILQTLAEMCDYPMEEVELGIDGCSVPNFALPLRAAAHGFARLCDPRGLPEKRAAACRTVVEAMSSHPEMVAGPGRFDTALMQAAAGRLIAKGGAEGYQGVGLLPGVLGEGSPALGITIKIADGDAQGRARAGLVLDVLQKLGALDEAMLAELADYGPEKTLYNWRKLTVGQARPAGELHFHQSLESTAIA